MGNMCSSTKITISDYKDFCPLRIATLYADIDESINKKNKIDTIIEYFMKPYHGYNLDVLCIQGIKNYKILKEIICAFKNKIDKYNDDNRGGYNKSIYLEYYPDIETNNENEGYWNTSETDDDNFNFDKLIISRHNILQSGDIQIGTYSNIKINNSSLMINNDSDEIANLCKYIQFVNINIDGTFISIYNVELEDDSLGISSYKERKKQLIDIKNFIINNRKNNLKDDIRQYIRGDRTYIATNRDIHIVTGMFHINEVKNGSTNTEYSKILTTLDAVDIYRWIATLRKEIDYVPTNVKFTKDTFTFLISKNYNLNNPIQQRSQKLYEDHKTVIISSNINKHVVDMSQFTNYPEDTIFMLYKPNVRLADDIRSLYNKLIQDHENNNEIVNIPKKFVERAIIADRDNIPVNNINPNTIANQSQISFDDMTNNAKMIKRTQLMRQKSGFIIHSTSNEKPIQTDYLDSITPSVNQDVVKIERKNTDDITKIEDLIKQSKKIADNINNRKKNNDTSTYDSNDSDDSDYAEIEEIVNNSLNNNLNNISKTREISSYKPTVSIDGTDKSSEKSR